MLSPFTSLSFWLSWPFRVLIDLPPEYLPPDLDASIADMRSTYFGEILAFLTAAATVVISVLLLRAWIRSA